MADWVRGTTSLMSMTSPLSGSAPIATYLVADEQISQPFNFEISIISQNGPIDPNAILNMAVCVTLNGGDDPVRYFHGIVQRIRSNGLVRGASTAIDFNAYILTVVPRVWFMNQTLDCRVYQAKTAKDIISAMFTDAALTDVQWSIQGTPATRVYTVQFNETDYTFMMRLMEQEGWFYYHTHSDSAHTIVITDSSSAFPAIANATLRFAVNDNDLEGIFEWKPPVGTAVGSFAAGDYDPTNPGTKLYNKQTTVLKAGGATARDFYHWPSLTFDSATVEARANFEIQAAEAATALYHGVSHFGALVPGGQFTLTNSPSTPDDGSYAIRAVRHVIEDSTWISNDGHVSYQNRFEVLPAATPWRQPLVTPHPRMDGIYSALVLGPQNDVNVAPQMQNGEEIQFDALASVRVRFFWDWRAEATGGGAVWARVIQPWAGNGWGAQFIPRVGTEVAVAFIDGHPDRPIVVGNLYNGVSTPIYSTSEATKSGFRTRSSLSGSTSQFSEFTFDDKSGSELIYMHAEKDLTTEVENNESLTVDNCRVVLVKADETITVQGKQTITITKDHTFEVTQGNFTSTIDQGNASYTVSTGNLTTKVSTGNESNTVSTGNYTLEVNTGNISEKADLGSISIQAMQGITLTCGQSSIQITPTGITLSAVQIKVAGNGQVQVSAPMTQVSGSGMLKLSGGVTMIN
jgi:type VI secretion system secreted protein VgrG